MNTAVVGLIRGHDNSHQYMKVIRRNRLLKKNLPGEYDIIIFHEGNLNQRDKELLLDENRDISFIDVGGDSFEMPENISKSDMRGNFGLGYRHMCQFRTVDQWKYLQQYDYIMQLDDDGWIESPIKYDIFEYCQNNDHKFCYIDRRGETHQRTVETLPQFTKNYIIENSLDINCSLDDIHLEDAIINHIYITDVSFWQRKDVQAYLKTIEESGGIYKYRWGDSPIFSLAVKMFMRDEHIKKIDDFYYTHGNHNYSNYRKQPITNMLRKLPNHGENIFSGLSLAENIYWRYWQIRRKIGSSW